MNSAKLNLQRGFSLIELVIVIVLTAIIAVISSQILSQGFNAYLTNKNINEADWQARYALAKMALDIRQINGAAYISTATALQLTFVNNAGTTITYSKTGTNLNRSGIVLASGVNAFALTYYTNIGTAATAITTCYVGISINITQNNTNITESTRIALRNI